MPQLPQLARTDRCPDEHCRAPIGTEHTRDCHVAICLHTGAQRLPHTEDPPADPDHDCGLQTWTGYPPGSVEAAAHGLWVRPATAADTPFTGWLPCQPGDPGARPDLDRVMRSATWDRRRQVYDITTEDARD